MRELIQDIEAASDTGGGERPSAWGLLPGDLARLGCPGAAEHVFGRLQRPWAWERETPRLAGAARDWMRAETALGLPRLVERAPSEDGTTRCVLALGDGRRVEAVHMPRDVGGAPRVTLCLSSQVGCAMGCTFCATASMGLVRNLAAGEMVGQVLALMRALGPDRATQLNLVFMGMGEPLHNLEALEQALRVLCHPAGLGLSPRRITVSTSGLVPAIEKLALSEVRPRLAVSLNATTDARRGELMPVNRKWDLEALRAALVAWPSPPGEKVLVEYVLLEGQNDADADAERLVAWLSGFRHHLNVIPFNPHEHSAHRPVAEARRQAFVERLQRAGCLVTVRQNRGRDVRGACGQLVQAGRRGRGAEAP